MDDLDAKLDELRAANGGRLPGCKKLAAACGISQRDAKELLQHLKLETDQDKEPKPPASRKRKADQQDASAELLEDREPSAEPLEDRQPEDLDTQPADLEARAVEVDSDAEAAAAEAEALDVQATRKAAAAKAKAESLQATQLVLEDSAGGSQAGRATLHVFLSLAHYIYG